jgi:type VI secretion system protein VasD
MVERPPHRPAGRRSIRPGRRFALLQLAGLSLPLGLTSAVSGCGMFGSKPPPPMPALPPPPPPPPPPPTQVRAQPVPVKGTITAAADLNPSATQRPSPLVLRIYELRSDTAFSKADFIALYQSEQATIGPDLVLKDEFVVAPGEKRPYERTLSIETRWLAVFGAYRNVERAVWRAITPVPPGKQLQLTIRADSQALSLSLQP